MLNDKHSLNLTTQNVKMLLKNYSNEKYNISTMEEEIITTLLIEKIVSTRISVRHILNDDAPNNSDEIKAHGIKRGLDFICDTTNKINDNNLYQLYMLSIGDFLEQENKLLPNNRYRYDSVYVGGVFGIIILLCVKVTL
jgi:hypothetical protein